MNAAIYKKYAKLLTDYALYIKEGEKVGIRSSYLAEPLLQELIIAISEAGGIPVLDVSIARQTELLTNHSYGKQLEFVSPLSKSIFSDFDAYLFIQAPFNLFENKHINEENKLTKSKAMSPYQKMYRERTANGKMKRSLCVFPTPAAAQYAEMTLKEYEDFVFRACYLDEANPIAEWGKVHNMQQRIVDHLNQCKQIQYKGSNIDISFSVDGRTWINSDGKANMPSGEVFSAPVENSVNGWVKFTYTSLYNGNEVEEVELKVKDGEVVQWNAKKGKEFLDKIFAIKGANYFGEVAIGTNERIQKVTKNILFDEKIGGSIHMAIGQSYYQCGGKNDSPIHWDMITDMKEDGQIVADGERIYEKGKFLI